MDDNFPGKVEDKKIENDVFSMYTEESSIQS